MTWHKTKYPGVRYREHPTRKHGIHPDRYFVIRYKQKKESKEEGLGWASQKWTAEKAAAELAALKNAYKAGKGEPTRLVEKRQAEEERRKKEALEKAQQFKNALTFGEFFKRTYSPIAEQRLKPRSYSNEKGHFKYWIEPVIGNIPLKDLRPIHLEKLKKNLQEKKKSPRTIEYVFSTVRSVWNTARKHRVIEGDSPTKDVKKPKVENRRVRFLTTEEAQYLLEDLESRDLATYQMAFVSLFTGLRAGEIYNLKWKNLDRENGLVWVMDSKSGKSRAVYIPNQVKDVFEEMTQGKPEDLIFPGPDGKPRRETTKYFRTAVRKLGFNEGITDRREKFSFHSLRHTAASLLIQSGVDLYTVKEILGHGSIALTERYSHLADHALKQAAQKMPDLTRKPKKEKVVILRKGGEWE
ncbi:MAG: tyrosine-type recombinase/integrase [Thermodesulfobacteriota bacterium]